MSDPIMETRFKELDNLKVREWMDGVPKLAVPGYKIESVTLTISVTPSAVIKFIPKS
jgi:hypothetical protein